MFHTKGLSLSASVGFAALLYGGSPAFALTATGVAPPLGLAYGYTVLGTNAIPTTGTVTCTTSTITGNVGTTGASISNTGCAISGSTDVSLPLSGPGAVTDFKNAYSQLDVMNPNSACLPMPTTTGTILPGIYCSAASTTLGAGVIFTLSGNASDVWVFKVGDIGSSGAFTGTDFNMVMGGTAQACNVYWRTAAAATMTRSIFIGTVLSGSAISVTNGSFLGRALATTDVALTNVAPIAFAGCALATPTPTPTPPGATAIPALSGRATIMFAALLALLSFAAIRRLT
jgi:Ice-binding-like